MAITFVCGFECQVAIRGATSVPAAERHWNTSSTGVPAISTSTKRTGTAALRCNAAGASVSLDKDVARKTVSGRVYVQFASLPASSSAFLRMVGTANIDIEVDNAGAVVAHIAGGTTSASAGTVSTGTWYLIDWLADTTTGTASLKIRLDGGTERESTLAVATANMTGVQFGPRGAITCDAFYDDIIYGDSAGDYPFGVGTVEGMHPTRDGTHSFTAGDFGYDTAGANVGTGDTTVYQKLDDAALTDTSDLIRQKVIRTTGYVEIGFGTAPYTYDAQAINVVNSYHAAGTGADTFGVKMNDGGTIKALTDEAGDGIFDVSDTTIAISDKILTSAPSGGSWTKTKIDAILIRGGYSGDVNAIPYWDGCAMELAYGAAPAAGTTLKPPMTVTLVSNIVASVY